MAHPNEVSFIDLQGQETRVQIDVTDYMAASERKMSLSQYYAMKYPTDAEKVGASTLEQFCMSAGLRLRPDHARGIPASSLREVIHGAEFGGMTAGFIVRPEGQSAGNVAARVLFPEVMMQMVASQLIASKEDYLAPWEAAIAVKNNVSGARADQAVIDVTAPEGSAAQPISQLAEPAVMVSITLNGKSYAIPTKSIGLQISDEAQQAATLDVIAVSLASQARGERIRRIEADMANMVNGDVDTGTAAVTFVNASTFHPGGGINASTPITHRAWVKWLRANYQTMSITHVLSSDDSALDIEARPGRPTAQTDTTSDPNRFSVDMTLENMGVPTPKVLLLPASVLGADRIVGFDSRYAMQQFTNVNAGYSAVEQFVLRRATGFRFDYGVMTTKLFNSAWTGLVLKA